MNDSLLLIHEKLDRIDEKATLACRLLNGNGNPEQGIVLRLDRIEQVQARRNKWSWLIASTVVAQFIVGSAAWLKGYVHVGKPLAPTVMLSR